MAQFYQVQCLNGHVWRVHHSSPMGVRALAREKKGFLDALPVPCTECDQCNEDLDRANQSFSDEVRDESWFANHPEDMLPSKEQRDAADRAFDDETHGDEY